MRADRHDIAAEVDEPIRDSPPATNVRGAIGGVFLADPAEVDLHLATPERQPGPLPRDLVQADAREDPRDLAPCRRGRNIVPPDFAQRAGGDVEQTVGKAIGLKGRVDEVGGLEGQENRAALLARRVDRADDAVRSIARIGALDPAHFRDRRAGGARRRTFVVGVESEFAARSHRGERIAAGLDGGHDTSSLPSPKKGPPIASAWTGERPVWMHRRRARLPGTDRGKGNAGRAPSGEALTQINDAGDKNASCQAAAGGGLAAAWSSGKAKWKRLNFQQSWRGD